MSTTSSADDFSHLTAPPSNPPTDFSPSAKTPPIYDASSGKWANPWPGWHQNALSEIIRMSWQTIGAKPLAGVQLDSALPVVKPTWGSDDSAVHYTWLGHASALVQLYGVNVLIDPIFSDRCAPVQFAGPKRYRPAPCTVAELPPIDMVLISHNHYDHLDSNTVKQLAERAEKQRKETGRTMKWYVGKGIDKWLSSNLGVRSEDAVGLVWWQDATHTLQPGQQQHAAESATAATTASEPSTSTSTSASSLSAASSTSPSSGSPLVTCVPCQHFSVRNPLTDQSKTLWCGFTVTHRGFTFYYSGDTAYCAAFKQIGHHSPHINLAMLPIGAYEPSWSAPSYLNNTHAHTLTALQRLASSAAHYSLCAVLYCFRVIRFMKHIHVNPSEAVDMFVDVKADKAVGVHWYRPHLTPHLPPIHSIPFHQPATQTHSHN